MNETIKDNKYIVEFKSIYEFIDYIQNTPFNKAFMNAQKSSEKPSENWNGNCTYYEALELLKNGWSEMASKITQRLKKEEGKIEPTMVSKNVLSVQGYQPIVPLYLNNVPNNMITKRTMPVKQKVMILNKDVSYGSFNSSNVMFEESIKALQIVKKFESQNYRCNINTVFAPIADNKTIIVKIRIKSSNEKLNVSKVAFPLVHTAFLRRLLFRFEEVYPNISRGFVNGYGRPASISEIKDFCKGEYIIPKIINKDMSELKSIKDLENLDKM